MIILRQKNYSWDEIKRAAKTIGGSAAIGATGGMILAGRKMDKTSGKPDKKSMLIRPIIGAGVGALIGAGIYRAGHKERLKAKQIKDKFETECGMSPEEYFATNLPKGYKEIVDGICNEMKNLNKAMTKIKGLDYFYLAESYLELNPISYSKDSYDITYYLTNNKNTDLNNIPLAYFDCIAFEDVFYGGIVTYNTKTKKFNCNDFSTNSLKEMLLDLLETLYNYIKEDIEGMVEDDDQVECSKEFEVWKREYYNKAINLIKRIKI